MKLFASLYLVLVLALAFLVYQFTTVSLTLKHFTSSLFGAIGVIVFMACWFDRQPVNYRKSPRIQG